MYSKIIPLFNNTALNSKDFFYIKKSIKCLKFLNLLLNENFIRNYKFIYDINQPDGKSVIKVFLIKKSNSFLIKKIKQISKSSQPVYIKSNKIRLKMDSNLILLTDKGLMIDFKAKKLNLGGEIICSIFF
jgi:small subunit ribosomal protein S8